MVTPDEMRAIDAAAPEPVDALIGRAGFAVARSARRMLGGTYGRVVNVVAGKGNNGADGVVAANLLAQAGVRVRTFDAASMPDELPPADLLVDAAYGTGFHGAWDPPPARAARVLAVDIPTGVDGLTGTAGDGVWPADVTVTFAAVKPGLLLGRGREVAGHVDVADIGLDVSTARAHVVEASDVAAWWPSRAGDSHKWRAAVRIVAGAAGMTGAAQLASRAAMRAGSGMVVLTVPGERGGGATGEVVGRETTGDDWAGAVGDDVSRFGALVVGPGLGRGESTQAEVRRLVAASRVPMVLDADALHAVAGSLGLLGRREAPTVLTPHDGEFAALTGSAPDDDRFAATRRLAAESRAVVLLKGPVTIVAAPDGDALVVANGDQRLATAGTGDVLAGMIGAAMASGLSPLTAAASAAWLHAAAANSLPAAGLLAGDLPDALPAVVETFTRGSCTDSCSLASKNQYKNVGHRGAR